MDKKLNNPIKNNLEGKAAGSRNRFLLALLIILPSLILLWYIISKILCEDCTDNENTNAVFTAVVGLVGTWIGTILAFYYTKDNFESAERSTQQLLDKVNTSKEKLNGLLAEEIMLQFSRISPLILKEGKARSSYLLKDLLDKELAKFNRLPVFDSENKPVLMIHRSVIDKYLTKQALSGIQIDTLNLEDLEKSDFGDQIKKGFGCVVKDQTVAVTKALMESLSDDTVLCSDVFVTTTGNKNGQVLGWITNAMISEAAKV